MLMNHLENVLRITMSVCLSSHLSHFSSKKGNDPLVLCAANYKAFAVKVVLHFLFWTQIRGNQLFALDIFLIALLVIQHVILYEMLKYLLNAETPL